MTSTHSMIAAAALTFLAMGPTQGFATANEHHGAGLNIVAPADRPATSNLPLIKLAGTEGPEEEVTFVYGR